MLCFLSVPELLILQHCEKKAASIFYIVFTVHLMTTKFVYFTPTYAHSLIILVIIFYPYTYHDYTVYASKPYDPLRMAF
jgi:hypothetical protein